MHPHGPQPRTLRPRRPENIRGLHRAHLRVVGGGMKCRSPRSSRPMPTGMAESGRSVGHEPDLRRATGEEPDPGGVAGKEAGRGSEWSGMAGTPFGVLLLSCLLPEVASGTTPPPATFCDPVGSSESACFFPGSPDGWGKILTHPQVGDAPTHPIAPNPGAPLNPDPNRAGPPGSGHPRSSPGSPGADGCRPAARCHPP